MVAKLIDFLKNKRGSVMGGVFQIFAKVKMLNLGKQNP